MRKHYWKYAIAAVVTVLAVLAARVGARWQAQRDWFALQHRQLATIERIGEFPPQGWDGNAWKNAVVTLYNVWGNVTYHPDYSKISNQEMRLLQIRLEQILAEATPDNGMETVDRVFELLLKRGRNTEFISGYRNEFRAYGEREADKSNVAEPSRAVVPAARTGSPGRGD